MLNLNDVRFAYDASPQYAFNLKVAAGEILGISGPSGSGKSTLLDLIAGFQFPSSGQIILDGQNIERLQAEQRPVSILFQKDNLFEHLSVRRNIHLGTKTELNIPAKLAEVGLAEFEDRICADLSGGQQQRVALARTLARKKPILLLDEPFSALDDQTAQEMRKLVKKLIRQNNWHAILVSHHKADFLALADRVLKIHNGALVNS